MMTVESKTQRWDMRVAEDVDAIVRLAAEQTHQPLTDFVVQAATVFYFAHPTDELPSASIERLPLNPSLVP